MKTLIWFRQDLRLADNLAVCEAFAFARQQLTTKPDSIAQVEALYIVSPKQWQSHDVAPIQIDFIERHVNILAQGLASLGVKLNVVTLPWFDDVMDWMPGFIVDNQFEQIFASQEPEFNERKRDQQLLDIGLPITFVAQDCIINAGEVNNLSGQMYKVFTPFSKKWREIAASKMIAPLSVPAPIGAALPIPATIEFDATKRSSKLWRAGEGEAKRILDQFCLNKIQEYQLERDFPALDNTSKLSPYLAIGVISAKQCLAAALNYYPEGLVDDTSPAKTWINELAWREFYRHLLVAFPRLSKGKSFNEKGDYVVWRNEKTEFAAWCEGRTGFPIVDAAMRQLNQTGWMHNRLRMVVASFLTKHLLIDWRWGERYFRQQLIDGDLAANNGGWQWSAGTGCDAQPYFRVFNPMNQSSKFDPDASFIKKYVPELKNLPLKAIHQPTYIERFDDSRQDTMGLFTEKLVENSSVYPSPIVEHSSARKRAIEVLSSLKR
ncbi:deoxyribodipyrimidine photo-lyase [Shewanella olleyana]|uniref:cryptochrome/photolyase family protein n=1 Tax=Shewanella olleyana TaxID=135626 RepID=UPI00200BC01A|nr:FAD-binding domain-containing protein [Shewanella olleyana]MCL1067199.1 deoxyribodipyrimidine photo-lyase [Shewanella olleyana]